MKQWKRYGQAAAIAAAVVMSLTGQTKRHQFSPQEKAFYADATLIDFVNPGLTITVNSATIGSDGTITVAYTLTDPNRLPLDSTGATTPGTIRVSFVAAVLPNGTSDYKTYTTSTASGTLLTSIQQPSADSGGATTILAPGQYQYVPADLHHLPVFSQNIGGHAIQSFGAADLDKPLRQLGSQSMSLELVAGEQGNLSLVGLIRFCEPADGEDLTLSGGGIVAFGHQHHFAIVIDEANPREALLRDSAAQRNHVEVPQVDAAFGERGVKARHQGLVLGTDRADKNLRGVIGCSLERPGFYELVGIGTNDAGASELSSVYYLRQMALPWVNPRGTSAMMNCLAYAHRLFLIRSNFNTARYSDGRQSYHKSCRSP
jgi:hypothetical protein